MSGEGASVDSTYEGFMALDLKVGTILRAELNEGARDHAYKLWIDVGDGETVQSSAKIADLYGTEELVSRQVIVLTGLEPVRVGGFRSDVLVLGALTDNGVVLIAPDTPIPQGSIIA